MLYLKLFYEFFKIGLFAIGGGLATIPFLYDLADKTGWFTRDFLGTMVAIAESTPGPIGINTATYVGYTSAGLFGGAVSTLGIICPSVIVIILVFKVLDKFKGNKLVDNAFYGIRPAVIGMISAVSITMIRLAVFTQNGNNIFAQIGVKELVLFVALLIATNKVKIHPIVWIIIAGTIGGIFKF